MAEDAQEFETIAHVRIKGRVQGVWYRGWVEQEAKALGLSGWVRNRSDGSVEALFAGSSQNVGKMLVACRKGPPAALVTDIFPMKAPDAVLPPLKAGLFMKQGTV